MSTEGDYFINKYYLIDKVIINKNEKFDFDIYAKNTIEERVSLVLCKNYKILKNRVDELIAYRYLYVHESEKKFYDKYFNGFMNQKVIPNDMDKFYEEVGLTIDKMFKDPESLANYSEVKNIVTNMVKIILDKKFMINSFISILASNYYTHTHSLNVSVYAICLGKHLGLKENDIQDLGISALLHDLGKSKIKVSILNKVGTLTEYEFNEMKKHPLLGWLLAKRLGITNRNILAGIRNHHEKMDGTGYPDRQKDEDIHLFAKIIGICDVFDALTTKRVYKDAVSTFETLIMMKKEMSQHLDPRIVDDFIKIFKEEKRRTA
ncbi:HD-GYP domain-containing protein [Halarcobacter sp.]|uniref:HD-GYP domain-containing protein n=1 Tax=Halarcobacter sp. TaxID=2321133 RepID=UPI0029F50398|nr:HD-GYP domain-containing protein [Halarcobacter sp.]